MTDVDDLLAIRERLRPVDREDVRTVGRIVSRNMLTPKKPDEKYDEFVSRIITQIEEKENE